MTTFLKTMLCAQCYFWKRRGGNICFSKYPAMYQRGLSLSQTPPSLLSIQLNTPAGIINSTPLPANTNQLPLYQPRFSRRSPPDRNRPWIVCIFLWPLCLILLSHQCFLVPQFHAPQPSVRTPLDPNRSPSCPPLNKHLCSSCLVNPVWCFWLRYHPRDPNSFHQHHQCTHLGD